MKRITNQTPIHMVLLADNSGSMRFVADGQTKSAADHVSEAIRQWVASLRLQSRLKESYFKFTMIVFDNEIDVVAIAADVVGLDVKHLALKGKENATTAMHLALDEAAKILRESETNPAHCAPFVFLYTDGNPDDPAATLASATQLKELELPNGRASIVTIGFGDMNEKLLESVASNPDFFLPLHDAKAIVQILPYVGTPTAHDGGASIDAFSKQIKVAASQVKAAQLEGQK